MADLVAWSGGGAAEGRPEVVFVPGLGAPGYLLPWARAAAEWAAVTVLDLPGWRWGRARHSAPTVEGIAAATGDWLRWTGRRGVVLVGHSTAAQVVARCEVTLPELLAGTVLAGPVFDPTINGVADVLRRLAGTARHESAREVIAVQPHYLHSAGVGLVRMVRDTLGRTYARGTVRSLVVTGAEDRFAPPSWARELAARRGAEYRVLPGGHNFCFRHPRAASGALHEAVARWGEAVGEAME
jgi:pimeloyl-ACP methyl ester carboxylesterase